MMLSTGSFAMHFSTAFAKWQGHLTDITVLHF